jgi:hypothetical protein
MRSDSQHDAVIIKMTWPNEGRKPTIDPVEVMKLKAALAQAK